MTAELQREMKPLLVPIHCEGFKSKICTSGFDAAFLAVAKYILKGQRPEKEKGLINLFAPTTVSCKDNLEMERMLEVLGLHANVIPFYSSLDKLLRIPSQRMSTSTRRVKS